MKNANDRTPVDIEMPDSGRKNNQRMISFPDETMDRMRRAASACGAGLPNGRNANAFIRQLVEFALVAHERWEMTPAAARFWADRRRADAKAARVYNKKQRAFRKKLAADDAADRARARILRAA